MKTIETKLAKNGRLIVKVDGKRASLQDANQAVFDSYADTNVVEIKTHLGDIFTGGFDLGSREYVFNHTFSSNPDKITGIYAFGTSAVVIEQIARHNHAEYKISEAPTEVDPEEYAISDEALEVATNAEICNAEYTDVETKLARLYHNKALLTKEEFEAVESKLIALLKSFSEGKILSVMVDTARDIRLEIEDSIVSELFNDIDAEIDTANAKEETQMTKIEVPAEGTLEITIGDDTVKFFNGKFYSVFSAKYRAAIARTINGVISYRLCNSEDENNASHEVGYDNFMATLYQRGNREKLLALRKDYSIISRPFHNSSMWYVNAKRSSQVKVLNLLLSYGLTY